MDRSDFFFKQKVTEGEVDAAFQYAEDADIRGMVDLGFLGAIAGLVVSPHIPLGLSVDVSGGVARSPLGERIYVPSTQQLTLSTDWQNVSTAVNLPGNSKIVSIFVKFSRALQNPRTDGNGNNVYYDRLESFRWYVKQGAEAALPVPPALEPDGILLADVSLVNGQVQIVQADIATRRRQDVVVTTGTPLTIRVGAYIEAFQALTDALNGLVAGGGLQIAGTSVLYAGSGPWVSGQAGIAAGTMEAAIDSLVAVLAATGVGASAVHKLGCAPLVGPSSVIGAGPLFATLMALKSATNIEYAGSGAFADGSSLPASSTEAAIDNVVAFLGSTVAPGAARSGMKPVGNFTATTVFGAFGELAAATAGNDGTRRLGAEVKGGFATTTARGQLDELDANWGKLARPNTWSGAQTVDNITASGATHYKLASRSIVMVQASYLVDGITGAATPSPANLAPSGIKYQSLVVPDGVTLTSVDVWIDPPTTGVLPASKPSVILKKRSVITGALANFGAASDMTAPASLYESHHSFSVVGLAEVIDRTKYVYYVLVTGEGTSTIGFFGCVCTYTTTAVPDGY